MLRAPLGGSDLPGRVSRPGYVGWVDDNRARYSIAGLLSMRSPCATACGIQRDVGAADHPTMTALVGITSTY